MKNEFPIKLQIGELNPVSLFGGCDDCAAIDSKGSIIYISRSFYKSPTETIKPIFLPSNEKAIDVECCNHFIFAVSMNGCLFKSKSDTDLSFTEVLELKETTIVSISGVYKHCFALSEDGKVFVYGDGSFGRVGLGEGINTSEFKEITSLNRYRIVAAYAGVFHSLFQTQERKIIACGELRLSEDKNERHLYEPVETAITNASYCIAGEKTTGIFTNYIPPMNPNKPINDLFNVSKSKTKSHSSIESKTKTHFSSSETKRIKYFIFAVRN